VPIVNLLAPASRAADNQPRLIAAEAHEVSVPRSTDGSEVLEGWDHLDHGPAQQEGARAYAPQPAPDWGRAAENCSASPASG
jgi:hypothetical protein